MSKQRTNTLSKSTLIRGLQCQKSLYLYKNAFHQRDKTDKVQQQKFDRGHRVGLLARKLFPNGRDLTPPTAFAYDQSIAATQALIGMQIPVLYEATFKHHGVLVALDILVLKDGKWYGYEVKSSFRVTKTYLLDAAIQYNIITKSGLPLEDFSIIHINNEYVKNGALEIHKLFKITSVKEDVIERQAFITETIENAIQTLSSETIPQVSIGKHCFKPYPCDFQRTCWKNIQESEIFRVGGLNLDEKIDLYLNDKLTLNDIPEEFKERERVKIQTEALKENSHIIKKDAFKAFLDKVNYPLFFFDLEAFQPAIPLYEGTAPFQNIPFQLSLHYKASEAAPMMHYEYICDGKYDPRREFLDTFLRLTELPGQIIVYNTLMEEGILNQLKALFPEKTDEVNERIGRFVDLETPFKMNWYYHPDMQGAYSLKAILPTLVPGAHYEDFEIKDGLEALAVFDELIYETDANKISYWRTHLLEYCKMDTYGLSQVYAALKRLLT